MRKLKTQTSPAAQPFVDFRFEEQTYQIDPGRRKVYRSFVEVETSRASQIMATYHVSSLKKH